MDLSAELKNLYPFESHYFSLHEEAEYKIHYIDEGRGDPILCLHGNPTWSFFYRNIVKELRSQYRVIAPDHLGCGLSGRPQDFSYTLANHINNVEKLVLHLDLKNITLIIHDWGGAIGMGFALRNKDRIRKLIILNTAAFLSKDIPKRIASLRIFSDFLIRRANLFCLAATRMTTEKKLPTVVKNGYLQPYGNYHDRIAIAGFVQDIPLVESDKSYKILSDIEKNLKLLMVPTLILWGAKDFCFHLEFFKTWKRIYPHADTVVYENAGHYVLEDEQEKCIQRIRSFLL